MKDTPNVDMTAQRREWRARQLAGPSGVPYFDAEIREQSAALFKSALSADEAASLMTVPELAEILDGSNASLGHADVFAGGHMVRLADIHHRSNKAATTIAAEQLAKGATIRLRDIESFHPGLSAFAQDVTETFAARVQINLYLTPPGHAGFPPHFDTTDVFIIQVAGSKQWSLHPEYTNRVPLPDPNTVWDPEVFRPEGEPVVHMLKAGDVLYLPRGEMHSATCTEQDSLHLTVGLSPLTVVDLLQDELRRLSLEEVGLRQRVVLPDPAGAMEKDPVAEALRNWLAVLASRINPAQAIAAERAALSCLEEHNAPGLVETLAALKVAHKTK